MSKPQHLICDGNEAAAYIAYKVNDSCALYPITPSSKMSELAEEWASIGKTNIWNEVPSVFQMQSEAGVAGAMHGSLQTGSLTTTFTASQGLLLMIPNMYKIAGELSPAVIHVATRSVATHALSVFSDHSDIMAVRSTGFAMLGAATVQEAMDFALIAQASSLESSIPFVHFFDGFRTSHEINKIEVVSDEVIKKMIDQDSVEKHHKRQLTPDNPVVRGTAQGPDMFFESREAANSLYATCPDIVQQKMDQFATLTGRNYKILEYSGHPDAEQVIVTMASSGQTVEETVNHLNQTGEKVGLLKIRLFRPFSTKHLLEALPATCKSIAVLDRTKEPGSSAEPLYLDIAQAFVSPEARLKWEEIPTITGGRYGLSSKEFTPNMVLSIFENLKSSQPKTNFTIGINDDKTHLSLPYSNTEIGNTAETLSLIINESAKETLDSDYACNLAKIIGQQSNKHVQAYSPLNYQKYAKQIETHFRFGNQPIQAPYLVSNSDFMIFNHENLICEQALVKAKKGSKILVNTPLSTEDFWNSLSQGTQQDITQNELRIRLVDVDSILTESGLKNKNAALQIAFLCVSDLLSDLKVMLQLTEYLKSAFESRLNAIEVISLIEKTCGGIKKLETDQITKAANTESLSFGETVLGQIMKENTEDLPTSALPIDGTFATGTSKFEKLNLSDKIATWDESLCTQCGKCSLVCPQSAIRINAYNPEHLTNAPQAFKSIDALEKDWKSEGLKYTIQLAPQDCTGCEVCVEVCSPLSEGEKALSMIDKNPEVEQQEKTNWEHFQSISSLDRSKIDNTKVSQQQLQEPLFEFPNTVKGCGETPYLKTISQLFGDRMLVANATGCSSIFGGNTASPWAKNSAGRGPAWSNSLFEDNAEFGLGFRMSIDRQENNARKLVKQLSAQIGEKLSDAIIKADQSTEAGISKQREHVQKLKEILTENNSIEAKRLLQLADYLVKKSVWIVGGDGWAYDIGYGGIDHAIASGKNVNILVIDNEVYSNTGGQMSKATPYGAQAKLAHNGKTKKKKDLGMLAMCYEDVYVASVAMGADENQMLKAFVEAEAYDGPSIIIAYAHCPSHGIDMKTPMKHHKAAVDSGQWMLYRHNPERIEKGLDPVQIDSKKKNLSITNYMQMEDRFDTFLNHSDIAMEELEVLLQNQVNIRYQKLRDINNGNGLRLLG